MLFDCQVSLMAAEIADSLYETPSSFIQVFYVKTRSPQ